jgi:hypothetical protein
VVSVRIVARQQCENEVVVTSLEKVIETLRYGVVVPISDRVGFVPGEPRIRLVQEEMLADSEDMPRDGGFRSPNIPEVGAWFLEGQTVKDLRQVRVPMTAGTVGDDCLVYGAA